MIFHNFLMISSCFQKMYFHDSVGAHVILSAQPVGGVALGILQNAECRFSGAESSVQSLQCRVQSAEYLVQSAECRVQSAEYRVQNI